MKHIIVISILVFSFKAWANSSIQEYSETSRVFDTLQSLDSHQFPGLIGFRYHENFKMPEFSSRDCGVVQSDGVLRLLTDYVESLNEVGAGPFDTVLFKDQMYHILGDGNYLHCVNRSDIKGHEKIDSFLKSKDGHYQLWLTEIYDD